MNYMRAIGKLSPPPFDFRHRAIDVIDREVHDWSRSKLFVLRDAEVEPHTSAIEERHRLAGNLKQEVETENVSIPLHGALEIGDADMKLAQTCNHGGRLSITESALAKLSFLC